MPNDVLRDALRLTIVERSIQVLRSHQLSDELIKKKLLESFAISEETLDELLRQ